MDGRSRRPHSRRSDDRRRRGVRFSLGQREVGAGVGSPHRSGMGLSLGDGSAPLMATLPPRQPVVSRLRHRATSRKHGTAGREHSTTRTPGRRWRMARAKTAVGGKCEVSGVRCKVSGGEESGFRCRVSREDEASILSSHLLCQNRPFRHISSPCFCRISALSSLLRAVIGWINDQLQNRRVPTRPTCLPVTIDWVTSFLKQPISQ